MNNERREKLEFVKQQGLTKVIGSDDKRYNLALIKELIGQRLNGEPECFGTHEEGNEICKKCFLAENGKCQELKEALNPNREGVISIKIVNKGAVSMKQEAVDDILKMLKLKSWTKEYKVAKTLLDLSSKNRTYGELIIEIGKIINSDDIMRAKLYFYKVRKKIEDRTHYKIDIMVVKQLMLVEKKIATS